MRRAPGSRSEEVIIYYLLSIIYWSIPPTQKATLNVLYRYSAGTQSHWTTIVVIKQVSVRGIEKASAPVILRHF